MQQVSNFEIIGEAANHLSDSITGKYAGVEWRAIRNFRNVMIHEYFNLEIVWNTVLDDLPELKSKINVILTLLDKG